MVVAEQMLSRLGKGAPEIIDARAKANEAAGDLEAAHFWQRVAKAIRHMLALDPTYIAPGKGPRPIELPPGLLRATFASLPQASMLLQPNLVIVAANRAYTALSRMTEEALVGADLFSMFPENPDDHDSQGEEKLTASLLRVLESGKVDRMPVQRYDIRRPDGGFEERWWRTTNAPVTDDSGRVELILHQTQEVRRSNRGRGAGATAS